jgi:hypothetical protein
MKIMTIREQKLFRAGLDILEDWCPRNQEDYLCGGKLPEDYWDETLCKRCWDKYLFKVMNE